MEENTCMGTKGLVKIFDEVAIQTRILALNLALESGQGNALKKYPKVSSQKLLVFVMPWKQRLRKYPTF